MSRTTVGVPLGGRPRDTIAESMYELDSSDPQSELIDRSGLDPEDVAQIGRLMHALSHLRDVEQALAAAAEAYMKLSTQDMRALHYLIVAKHRDEIVTPTMIANYLGISAASTTKLLNRLERAGHIVRRVHQDDRRAFIIEVTPETTRSAMQTIGKQQSRRFYAAARLTGPEREIVIRLLEDMANELSTGADWH